MNYTLTISANTVEELAEAIKGAAAQYLSSIAVIPAPPPVSAPTNPTPLQSDVYPPITGAPVVGGALSQPVSPAQLPNQAPPLSTSPSAQTQMTSNSLSNPVPVPLSTAPTYTIDQIAKAGAELAQAGKMNELLALLQQYGIQAVTQLNPEQIGPFATALRGLGANL